MGFCFAFSKCAACHQPFAYNPLRVPSVRINGVKEPLCRGCVLEWNVRMVKAGKEPHPIPDDAYEPIREEELG